MLNTTFILSTLILFSLNPSKAQTFMPQIESIRLAANVDHTLQDLDSADVDFNTDQEGNIENITITFANQAPLEFSFSQNNITTTDYMNGYHTYKSQIPDTTDPNSGYALTTIVDNVNTPLNVADVPLVPAGRSGPPEIAMFFVHAYGNKYTSEKDELHKTFSSSLDTGPILFWFSYNPTSGEVEIYAPSRLLRYTWNYWKRVKDAGLGDLTKNDITFTPTYDQTGDIMEKITLELQGRSFEFPVNSTFEGLGTYWGSVSNQSLNENTLNPDDQYYLAIFKTGWIGNSNENSFREFKISNNMALLYLVTIVNNEEINQDFFYADGTRLFDISHTVGRGSGITPRFDSTAQELRERGLLIE